VEATEPKPSVFEVMKRVKAVLGEVGEPVKEAVVYEAMETGFGLTRLESMQIIASMMRDGSIFSPRLGYYRRT
jgi:hypothetical protein